MVFVLTIHFEWIVKFNNIVFLFLLGAQTKNSSLVWLLSLLLLLFVFRCYVPGTTYWTKIKRVEPFIWFTNFMSHSWCRCICAPVVHAMRGWREREANERVVHAHPNWLFEQHALEILSKKFYFRNILIFECYWFCLAFPLTCSCCMPSSLYVHTHTHTHAALFSFSCCLHGSNTIYTYVHCTYQTCSTQVAAPCLYPLCADACAKHKRFKSRSVL